MAPRLSFLIVPLVIALAGCQSERRAGDMLRHVAPPGWGVPGQDYVVGYRDEMRGVYQIVEFIKVGDTIDNWHELITNEDWALPAARRHDGTVRAYVDRQAATYDEICPGRFEQNIIESSEHDIIYETMYRPCQALADEMRSKGQEALAKAAEATYYEISRIMDGTTDRWRIAYAVKGAKPDDAERQKWLDWLQSAQVMSTSGG